MFKRVYEVFNGSEITDLMLEEARQLFNENYGVWGVHPAIEGYVPKPGTRVKLSRERLRAQFLPTNAECSYVKVSVDDRLVGNAFASRWQVDEKTVCWITQLVVHSDYRGRGLASTLLNCVRQVDDDVFGILSSHPAACLAAVNGLGSGTITSQQLEYIRKYAPTVMRRSPIEYIRDAELRGSIFDPKSDDSGAISSANTNFFVDHDVPLKALNWIRERREWPLGELLEGHEFLLLMPNSRWRPLQDVGPNHDLQNVP